jgi:hypothetical protein
MPEGRRVEDLLLVVPAQDQRDLFVGNLGELPLRRMLIRSTEATSMESSSWGVASS